jgi:transcriptional regulator GlxA family with amidase domain
VADILRQRYPEVLWRPEQFVTQDGRLFCSGGVYASIDLSLYLVEKFCGHEIALQCAKSLLVSMPRSRQSGYSAVPLSPPHSDDKIKQAEEYLQEHFDRDVSIEMLAGRIGMGSRNFIRRFKAATGRLPGAYIQMLRVSAAQGVAGARRRVHSERLLEDRLRGCRVLQEPVEAPHRHDTRRISKALRTNELRPR